MKSFRHSARFLYSLKGSSRGHPPRESLANWLRSSVGRYRHVGHAGGVCGLGRPSAAPSQVDGRSWERHFQFQSTASTQNAKCKMYHDFAKLRFLSNVQTAILNLILARTVRACFESRRHLPHLRHLRRQLLVFVSAFGFRVAAPRCSASVCTTRWLARPLVGRVPSPRIPAVVRRSAPLVAAPFRLALSACLLLPLLVPVLPTSALGSGGETPSLVGLFTTPCTITRGDLPLQKTIFCLATLRSRLLMHGSAVRGLRLIATSRRGARDLSCSHGGDCAARKVRASASEVKGGGGYDHPLTHGPVFQRDRRIIERLAPGFGDSAPRTCRPEAAAPETRSRPLPFSN